MTLGLTQDNDGHVLQEARSKEEGRGGEAGKVDLRGVRWEPDRLLLRLYQHQAGSAGGPTGQLDGPQASTESPS